MISDIKWNRGLIPAVIQDSKEKDVLMLAYMNQEALSATLKTGMTHFYSRSRKKLWRKGETSGHIQKVKAVSLDCDRDAVLVEVEQVGVACHTGKRSCFFNSQEVETPPVALPLSPPQCTKQPVNVLEALYATILARKARPVHESYTSALFEGGLDLILKKVAEEAGEFVISAKNGERGAIAHEAADLLYHLWVALAHQGVLLEDVEKVLRERSSRSGLAEKRARLKGGVKRVALKGGKRR